MANIITAPESGIYFDGNTAGVSSIPTLTGDASGVAIQYDGYAGIEINSSATGANYLDRFSVEGANGRLFGVTDEVTGTVFSVNDAAGLPIIEVESTSDYDKITIGEYGTDALVISGSSVQVTGATVATQAYVDAQVATSDTLQEVTDNGATTSNLISIHNDSTVANPRLSVGRDSNQSIQFSVTDTINTIQANQDADSNSDHKFILNRYFSGSGENDFQIQKAGSPQLTIDKDGNVGIGNTAPFQKLSVNGIINSDTNEDYYGAWMNGNSAAGQDSYFAAGTWYNNAGYFKFIQSGTPHRLSIYTYNTSDHVTLQEAGGNVGIGTTSPAVNLHVESSTSAQFKVGNGTQFLRLYADADEATILADGSVDMRFYTAGAEKMRIDTNGNVGIGTTSPSTKLDVDGLISSDQIQSKEYTSLTGSSGDWFPIGTVTDGSTGPVYFNVSTIYHSSMSFMVGDGWPASGQGNITLLNSVYNTNSGYANITAARLKDDGVVEIKLEWSTGPTVNIKITARSTTGPLALPASLATATSTSTVRDTVTNETGKLRSKNLITTDSNVVLNNSGDSYLNGGNVGIGTTSPAEKLEVVGQAIIDGGVGVDSAGTLHLRQKGNTASDGLAITSAHATSHRIWKDVNGKLNIGPSSSSSAFVQDLSGNVGIGTTSPNPHSWGQKALTVQAAGTNAYSALETYGTGTGAGAVLFGADSIMHSSVQSTNGSHLVFTTNASNSGTSQTERMRILSSGQLIVGGTAFGYSGTDLQVGNTSDSQNGLNILTSTTGYGYVLFGDGLANADSYVGQISYKHGDDYMMFQTNGSERMRINSSGNVGIGTTSLMILVS
jgi:hypothetical protein